MLCWGRNDFGQLGSSANAGTSTPTIVPTLIDDGALGLVHEIAAGYQHTCALRDDGRVLCWGHNKNGQLGISTNAGTDGSNPGPFLVGNEALGVVRHLAAGVTHSCAVREDGRVLCWGANRYGQLGSNTNVGATNPNPTPLMVDDSSLAVARFLALGAAHSCAVRDDGRVLCWGNNGYGQLGNATNVGTSSANPAPALVEGVPPLAP